MLQVLRNEILPLIVPSTGSRLRKIERIPIVAWTRRRDRIRSHLTLQILPVYRFRPIVDLFLWHFLKFERTLASTPRRGRKYRRRNVELNLTDAEILRRFHIKVQGKNWSPCRNACLVLKSSTGLNLYFSSCRRNGIYICLKKKKMIYLTMIGAEIAEHCVILILFLSLKRYCEVWEYESLVLWCVIM